MTRIGLLSDTHGYLDPSLEHHFDACDEIWHAGDIGNVTILETLHTWAPVLRAVYGNIDPPEIQRLTQEDLFWHCEDTPVFMTHIAGYPGRYNKRVLALITSHHPQVVICGHSHILKILYDNTLGHLHINPGACGRQGMHHMRTAVRFSINGDEIRDMQVIELGKRGAIREE